MKIILDCDDVLYKTNEYALEILSNVTGENFSIYDIHSWGLLNNSLDARLSYFKDPRFVFEIPLYEAATMFVKNLSKISDVYLVTGVEPACTLARYNRIKQDFPMIDPDHIIFAKDKSLLSADWLLDDGAHNVKNADHVKNPILMQRPWNQKENLPSVKSLFEFYCIVANVIRKELLIEGGCLYGNV